MTYITARFGKPVAKPVAKPATPRRPGPFSARHVSPHMEAKVGEVMLAVTQKEGHRKGAPLNHIGVQVDDLDAVEAKVLAAGLTPYSHDNYEPGKRFYFFDGDGVEFEVVSYAG
mgnify:CR=1 FL=1